MCNIAGYSGNQQAAPILLEMLRKQEPYDGDMSTGVVTIHEGKLYIKKLVGNVDDFLREIDLSELPGTIGIAHTRPAGSKDSPAVHPTWNPDCTMAIVTNGTGTRKFQPDWAQAAVMLNENGYNYPIPDNDLNKVTNSPRLRILLMDYYTKQGMSITEAFIKSTEHIYTDNVSVVVSQKYPDSIFALRVTRPMQVILENGEAYMATTRYAFPETLKSEPIMLPLAHACIIKKDGIHVTPHKINREPVEEMTPYTYKEAYKRFEKLLKSKDGPFYFDDLEYAVGREMRDLWPNDRSCIQHGRLVYDMLWQFDQEGRLKREVRVQDHRHGPRRRWYFWLED